MVASILPKITSFARSLLDDANAAAVRTTIDAQQQDDLLDAIAALSMVADRYIYGTGTDTVALGTITSFARTLLDDADAGTVLTTLGVTADAQLLLADSDVPRISTNNDWGGNGQWGNFSSSGASRGVLIQPNSNVWEYDSSATTTASRQLCKFYNPNGLVGTIAVSGSATAYNTSSDRRLKDNISDLDTSTALARVMAIRLREFTWKADGAAARGVIADELAEVIPEAITGEPDAMVEEWAVDSNVRLLTRSGDEKSLDLLEAEEPDAESLHKLSEAVSPQGVDYSKLVPDLIGAIQAQAVQIAALQKQVAALSSTRLTK